MVDLFYDSLEKSWVIWKFESSAGFQICAHRREEDPRNFNKNREEGLDQQTCKKWGWYPFENEYSSFCESPVDYTSEEVWVGEIRPKGYFQLTKTELFEAMISPSIKQARRAATKGKLNSAIYCLPGKRSHAWWRRASAHLPPPKVYELPVYRRMGWKLLRSHLDDTTGLISTKNRC